MPYIELKEKTFCNAIMLCLQTVERHFKDAIQGDKVAVTFAKSCLTVGIPDDGVLARGWKITCTTSKTVN